MLNIRRATEADTPAVLALVSRVWPDDYVPDAWPKWVADGRGIPLVAELEGKIVGICHVARLTADECWFNAMRVDPARRRQGFGTALTKAAIDAARAAGYRAALLGIDPDNTASLEMTARAGFTRAAEYRKLTLTARPGLSGPPLRPAVPDEVPQLKAIAAESARRDGVPAAVYWDWEWADLSDEALHNLVASGDCLVRADGPLDAYLPVSCHDDGEIHAFNPYGPVAAVLDLVRGLLARAGERGAEVGIFLPLGSPYREPLIGLGFAPVPDDGFIIWRMEL